MTGRVCMVVHEHFPRDFRVRREARALAAAGLEVTVVSLKEPGQPASERLDGLKVIRLPIRRHRGKPLAVYLAEYLAFASAASAAVAALHLKRRFDVVHVHSPPDFLIGAGLPARLTGARLVLDDHDLTPELYASRFRGRGGRAARFLTERAEQFSCTLADRVITTTGAFKRLLVERGVPPEKILVLHNCPDPQIFKPRRSRKKKSDFVIIHHGTMLHRYGLDILLDAYARVLPEMSPSRLEIYGTGDFLPRLRQIASASPLAGKVTFHGEVSQEQVARALTSADLCVVPNRTDPIMELAFPTKLLEALHVGVPVIASSTRLVAETFPSGGVHFVPPEDPKVLSDAILHLAQNPEARKSLAAEGRKQAKRFSWDREKDKLLGLYGELGVG